MKSFEDIRFKGTFRDYQQSILNNIRNHSEDKKIHIVAAPGSGKTVLGLELIRKLGRPALILSPTVTIRQQWGERFSDMFLPEDAQTEDYFSYHLTDIKLLTAVTYQGLHAAWTRTVKNAADDDENAAEERPDDNEAIEDYSGFDLVATVKAAGVTTICLDEAHHLRSEWQKALEGFITAVQQDVTIISLTATPPYDSPAVEWNRYISLCGEIDEEISVPELVIQKTLCPHQDYVCFNFPAEDEMASLLEYRERAGRCLDEIIRCGFLVQVLEASCLLTQYPHMEEFLLDNVKGTVALLALAQSAGVELPKKLVKLVSPDGRLPRVAPKFTEDAFQLVLDHPDIFTEEIADELRKRLSTEGLIHKKQVCLESNERLDKRLVSSAGKLSSIARIALAEDAALGNQLRLLVLTDYIKKDLMKIIGTNETIATVGTVTVFETLRREFGSRTPIGVLSGGLVILPSGIMENARAVAEEKGASVSVRALGDTGYCEAIFSGSNKHRVAVVTELFRLGLVRILVGTAALLGEGWDSPCVNSLILASFVGSFVLSNQMRGRAIRIDSCDPQKTSNIWHLCTVEPPRRTLGAQLQRLLNGELSSSHDSLVSADYETLKRRFDCFLAPAYHRDMIESGIRRADIIQPPFDHNGVERINRQMLTLASDRKALADKWARSLGGELHPEVLLVSEAPPTVQPKGYLYRNLLWETILSIVLAIMVRFVAIASSTVSTVAGTLVCALLIFGLTAGFRRILHFISPQRTINSLSECILNTLKDIGLVKSTQADIQVSADPEGTDIHCSVTGASLREKEVFAAAMRELLSAIDNPRYVLARRGLFRRLRYSESYACPSVIGVKKEYAERLMYHLQRISGAFVIVYTRNERGRAQLLKCRQRSYINRNDIFVRGKKVVRNRWE